MLHVQLTASVTTCGADASRCSGGPEEVRCSARPRGEDRLAGIVRLYVARSGDLNRTSICDSAIRGFLRDIAVRLRFDLCASKQISPFVLSWTAPVWFVSYF